MTTVAGNGLIFVFIFRENKGLAFYMNCQFADNSHEMPCLLSSEKKKKKKKRNLYVTVFLGALKKKRNLYVTVFLGALKHQEKL